MTAALGLLAAAMALVWSIGRATARRARTEANRAAYLASVAELAAAIDEVAADPRWSLLGATTEEAAAALRHCANGFGRLDAEAFA